MAPVFLLCFTDSVHGSTEQQVLLLESSKAQPWTAVLSPVLRCNTLSGQGKTFVAEHKSFCWVNSTAGFESSPRQRNYTIKSSELQQRCSQTKLLLDLLQQINNNSQLQKLTIFQLWIYHDFGRASTTIWFSDPRSIQGGGSCLVLWSQWCLGLSCNNRKAGNCRKSIPAFNLKRPWRG